MEYVLFQVKPICDWVFAILTIVGVWKVYLQHVLGVCSYLLYSAVMNCD